MPPTLASPTTTVTTIPTVSASPHILASNIGDKAHDTLPLGAIVGGVAGGVLLALLCLVGWRAWRKTTTHKRAKEKAASLTRQNTLRNSSDTTSKLRSSDSPLAWTPTAAKVKFATPEKEKDGVTPASTDSRVGEFKAEPKVNLRLKNEESGSGKSMTPSRPKALKASRSLNRHHGAKVSSGQTSEVSNVKLPIPPPPTVSYPSRLPRHKASTVSSGSYYSLESGEEYPARPARLHSVVSALGNLGDTTSSMPFGSRLSISSSMWSFLSRTSRGGRVPSNRLSQATSNSAYSQPEEPIVGVAY